MFSRILAAINAAPAAVLVLVPAAFVVSVSGLIIWLRR